MKRVYALPLLLLCGCEQIGLTDAPEVKACEFFIKDGFASPSSYDRVQVTRWTEEITAEELAKLRKPMPGRVGKPGLALVGIQYDADNSYGASIRGGQICAFETLDGEVTGSAAATMSNARSSASMRSLRALSDAGALPDVPRGAMGNAPKYDCCIS